MVKMSDLNKQADEIRDQVFALPNEKQKIYYQKELEQVRDPDTYAALNYAFVLGLHHLYLGKYVTFLVEMVILIVGVFLATFPEFSVQFIVGVIFMSYIGIKGVYELFRSEQKIMQYNLSKMNKILEDVKPPAL
jgi:TM2 domain-containing membrane protein YozV